MTAGLTDREVALGVACVVGFVEVMPPEAFFRQTRGGADESRSRQIMQTVLRRVLATPSMERMGKALGRDRSSVTHAIKLIEAGCNVSPELDAYVARLADLSRELLDIAQFKRLAMTEALEDVLKKGAIDAKEDAELDA